MGKVFRVFKAKRRVRRGKKTLRASKNLKKIIQKEIHKDAELKYFDNPTTANPYTLDATAEAIGINAIGNGLMSSIVQGTSNVTRVGGEIRVKRLSLRFRATAFSATATGVVFVVRFPQSNGGTPVLANIWAQVSDIAVAERDVDYKNDYHILGKILIQADRGTTLNRTYQWSKTYKGSGLKVEYDENAAADSAVEFNNVFLIAQSNGSDDVISLSNLIARVEYFDM